MRLRDTFDVTLLLLYFLDVCGLGWCKEKLNAIKDPRDARKDWRKKGLARRLPRPLTFQRRIEKRIWRRFFLKLASPPICSQPPHTGPQLYEPPTVNSRAPLKKVTEQPRSHVCARNRTSCVCSRREEMTRGWMNGWMRKDAHRDCHSSHKGKNRGTQEGKCGLLKTKVFYFVIVKNQIIISQTAIKIIIIIVSIFYLMLLVVKLLWLRIMSHLLEEP